MLGARQRTTMRSYYVCFTCWFAYIYGRGNFAPITKDKLLQPDRNHLNRSLYGHCNGQSCPKEILTSSAIIFFSNLVILGRFWTFSWTGKQLPYVSDSVQQLLSVWNSISWQEASMLPTWSTSWTFQQNNLGSTLTIGCWTSHSMGPIGTLLKQAYIVRMYRSMVTIHWSKVHVCKSENECLYGQQWLAHHARLLESANALKNILVVYHDHKLRPPMTTAPTDQVSSFSDIFIQGLSLIIRNVDTVDKDPVPKKLPRLLLRHLPFSPPRHIVPVLDSEGRILVFNRDGRR